MDLMGHEDAAGPTLKNAREPLSNLEQVPV